MSCHCPLNNSEADLERTEDEVEKKGVVVGGEGEASDDTEGSATEQREGRGRVAAAEGRAAAAEERAAAEARGEGWSLGPSNGHGHPPHRAEMSCHSR